MEEVAGGTKDMLPGIRSKRIDKAEELALTEEIDRPMVNSNI